MFDPKLSTYVDMSSTYTYKLSMYVYKLSMYVCMRAHRLHKYDYKLCLNICVVITLFMYALKHIRICMYVHMLISIEISL